MAEPKRSAETVIHEHERFFTVEDPLLGPFPLRKGEKSSSGIVADIIQTPLGQRALDITQLSKAAEHTTIPGTHRFHRLGHIAGLAEMTRRLAEKQGASAKQTDAYVLYASFSDLAHGPFSHATDIAVQGVGSNETYHESRVTEAFALGGVRDVFEDRGLKVNLRGELSGMPIPPWVESASPDVCVDRLQYTLHEMLLWFDGSDTPEAEEIRAILMDIASLRDIDIDDEGRMVFTNIDQARLLAKGYSLLSTEHWNDPVNRVQLYLLIESLKYSILNRRLPGMDEMDNGKTRQPLDYLYAIDSDVLAAMESEPGKTDPYLYAIEGQLADIGREEQRRFIQFKRRVYERFLTDERAEEYPSQILHPDLVDFGPGSSRFEISRLAKVRQAPSGSHPQVPQLTGENGDLHYTLFPLKNRRIDPLIKTEKGVKRLSEVDKKYALLIAQHQLIQRSALSVHIPTTPIYKDLLWKQAEEISDQFKAAQDSNPPLDKDPKRRSIETAAERARAHAISRGVYIDER